MFKSYANPPIVTDYYTEEIIGINASTRTIVVKRKKLKLWKISTILVM